MEKPTSLRKAMMSRIPELRNDPSRLVLWVEDGAVRARQTETHGFEFAYPLAVLLREVSTDIAVIVHAITRWLRVNQPDLLAGGAKDSFKFETDILDNGVADILFTLDLTESVAVTAQEDGSWSVEYQTEPDPLFTDGEPIAPNEAAPPLAGHSVEEIVAD